jgi:hypothetical protein
MALTISPCSLCQEMHSPNQRLNAGNTSFTNNSNVTRLEQNCVSRLHRLCCVVLHTLSMPRTAIFKLFPLFHHLMGLYHGTFHGSFCTSHFVLSVCVPYGFTVSRMV